MDDEDFLRARYDAPNRFLVDLVASCDVLSVRANRCKLFFAPALESGALPDSAAAELGALFNEVVTHLTTASTLTRTAMRLIGGVHPSRLNGASVASVMSRDVEAKMQVTEELFTTVWAATDALDLLEKFTAQALVNILPPVDV